MTRAADDVASTASSYEVLALLATGGMAEIYLARGASVAGVERYVVLKRILREKASDANFVRMFLDEARLAAQLQHPNIAQVYDIGKLGESFFFTMEYVHGETVRSLLHHSVALAKPIPLGCVLAIAAGAAAGLHHAHSRPGIDGRPLGIVHRDVSPSNLMVSFEGTVKLVDFGVAKAAQRTHETRSGTLKGKISYLSPEQCRGAEVDRRSDLFSLGIVLWETIAGERLFRRASDFDTMHAIVGEEPPSLTARRADVPAELDALVQKLLAKAPADRYQTADELHEDIDRIAVRAGVSTSASGLARYLRQVFGERPEPWVELRGIGDAQTVMTTSIAESDLMLDDPVEQALAQVIDIAGPKLPAPRLTAPTVASGNDRFLTLKIDRRSQDPLTSGLAGAIDVTGTPGSFEVVLTANGELPIGGAALAGYPQAPTAFARGPSDSLSAGYFPIASTPEPSYPSAGGLFDSPATPNGYSNYPAASYAGRAIAMPAPRRGRPLIIAAVVLGAVAAGVATFFALGGDGHTGHTGPTANARNRDAAPSRGSAIPTVAASAAGSGPPERGSSGSSGSSGSAVPVVARVIDPEVNAGSAATASGSADPTSVATTASPIAPVASGSNAAHPRADLPTRAGSGSAHPTEPVANDASADLASAMQNGRFNDAATLCRADSHLVARQAESCVLAACRTHDAERARRWLASVRKRRGSVLEACRAAGTTLDVRTPGNGSGACADPFACQH